MEKPLAPDVRNYMNAHFYLQDYYRHRKETELDFSYDVWARELEIKNRSYLRLIVIGKRPITERFLSSFLKKEQLSPDRKDYLLFLTRYSQSADAAHRELYGKQLVELMTSEVQQSEISDSEADVFLRDRIAVRLQTLLGYEDLVRTPKNLARLLDVSLERVEHSLHLLKKLGLASEIGVGGETDIECNLRSNEQVSWKALIKEFRINTKPKDQTLTEFHNESLLEAIEAQSLPSEMRKYASFLMSIDSDQLTGFFEDFQTFMRRQMAKYESKRTPDSRLYQVNFNFIPSSEKFTDSK